MLIDWKNRPDNEVFTNRFITIDMIAKDILNILKNPPPEEDIENERLRRIEVARRREERFGASERLEEAIINRRFKEGFYDGGPGGPSGNKYGGPGG